MQTACARAGEVLARAPRDDGHVNPRKRQLGRQHQPRRTSASDHHRMLCHGPEVYRKLGVREVWFYERGSLSFYAFRGIEYEAIERSELLPAADPALFVRCMAAPNQSEAIQTLLEALTVRTD
jgi:hypothetical protein